MKAPVHIEELPIDDLDAPLDLGPQGLLHGKLDNELTCAASTSSQHLRCLQAFYKAWQPGK